MKKCLLSLMVVLPCVAVADTLPVFVDTPPPVLFESDALPDIDQSAQTWQQERVVSPTFTMPDISKLSDDELQEVNLIYAEELISMAVAEQNWEVLQELLDIYQTMPTFDGILSEYAKGAMLRKQGDQKGAIAKYKSILASRPELSYVKLDLALMLLENRQLKDADKLLAELELAQVSDTVSAVVAKVRQDIKTQQRWQPTLSVNYESTDNVNQASPETKIVWLGKEWQKSQDSLPQSAQGIRYGIGLNKSHNVGGNHNLVAEGDVSGVSYWDNAAFNEQSVRLSTGYAYADIGKNLRIMPFFEQNWLDKEKYNQSTGISLGYGQMLGQKNRVQLGVSVAKKAYDDERLAKRYDGTMASVSGMLSKKVDNNTLLYGGLDTMVDNTKDKELASVRYGVRTGVIQDFDNGFGVNASVRYAKRTFDAPSTLVYEFVRKDDEYQANLAVWHNKLTWYGLRPQANVRYIKIDSNMPAFYSRDGLSYFMSVEKTF